MLKNVIYQSFNFPENFKSVIVVSDSEKFINKTRILMFFVGIFVGKHSKIYKRKKIYTIALLFINNAD